MYQVGITHRLLRLMLECNTSWVHGSCTDVPGTRTRISHIRIHLSLHVHVHVHVCTAHTAYLDNQCYGVYSYESVNDLLCLINELTPALLATRITYI